LTVFANKHKPFGLALISYVLYTVCLLHKMLLKIWIFR